MNKTFNIAGITINPGERKFIELPAANLYTQTPVNIPVHVIHGKIKGPKIFIIAAIHGDEINGVEIIRRLLTSPLLKNLHGTLIAVPVANVYGFVTLSRYLPDRRDLNRAFPGLKSGSLTARVANLFMEEIISRCTHGIDLHTGNIHSENLPHIRANVEIPGTLKIAHAFNVPVILDAKLPDGSLRQATAELKIPFIVYEGGEALRFNELAIRLGLRGIINVLYKLGMIRAPRFKQHKTKAKVSYYSTWARSPKSGIFHPLRRLGMAVDQGEKVGAILDPFEKKETEIYSPAAGVIIGRNTLPLVNEGDPLLHIAQIKGSEEIAFQMDRLRNHYSEDYLYDFTE